MECCGRLACHTHKKRLFASYMNAFNLSYWWHAFQTKQVLECRNCVSSTLRKYRHTAWQMRLCGCYGTSRLTQSHVHFVLGWMHQVHHVPRAVQVIQIPCQHTYSIHSISLVPHLQTLYPAEWTLITRMVQVVQIPCQHTHSIHNMASILQTLRTAEWTLTNKLPGQCMLSRYPANTHTWTHAHTNSISLVL